MIKKASSTKQSKFERSKTGQRMENPTDRGHAQDIDLEANEPPKSLIWEAQS